MVKKILAVLSVFSTAILGLAGTAQAGIVQWSDGYESNPFGVWERGIQGGDGHSWFDIGMGVARTGNNNGWLFADNGWSAMRTAKSLSSFPSNRSNCAAAIHADPVGGGANIGLEIWDPNGWRKISHTVKWIDDWAGYQLITLPNLNLNGVGTVYLQPIYGNNGGPAKYIRLDDAIIQCVY
ncbi:hypothetical protein DMC64_35895 [Amycolatopsis sp. WAC 04197]|nr:hypothetical protein DMC64_35895 [Amycolatopsis sp. WAC 04197]